jgi:hypothetical protein
MRTWSGGLITAIMLGCLPGIVASLELEARPKPTDTSPDFIPIPDRWRLGFPDWNRYERPLEAPYVKGRWWDPYNQNVLKGDYPILGQDIFVSLAAISDTLFEARRIPTRRTAGAASSGRDEVWGAGDQLFLNQNFILSFELFRGDTAFRPRDWEFRITPVFNFNYLEAKEPGVVDVDVSEGTTRADGHASLQEFFVEYHLGDVSPTYDFLSTRAGIQGFTSDFRGFIFSDNQLGFRLFGNSGSNRNQFNVAYFRPLEKDTNSRLNRLFRTRGQHLGIANYFRQDFIWPGYTVQVNVHYLHDAGGRHVDENGFLVRPAAVGQAERHVVRAGYLGWTGDGHIGRLNLTHAFYQAVGRDSRNALAGRSQRLSAQLAAVELSRDFDYLRPKISFLWSSGDRRPTDGVARGFDMIFDDPNFAGGGFSYWIRQGLPLTTTGTRLELVGRNSLLANLRTSKTEGQPNFVNPGLFLLNAGADVAVTPKLRALLNVNVLRFHHTQVLERLLSQRRVRHDIGIDYSLGFRYRPFLTENVVATVGASALTAGDGLRDVYADGRFPYGTLYSTFLALTFLY